VQPSGPSVRLRLLSEFELTRDGVEVPLQRMTQRLVAFLALRNRPLLRPYVAGTLWLHSSEERSAASLRSALWRLRGTGCGVVESAGPRLALAPTVAVDVREVTDLANRLLDRAEDVADRDPDSALAAELLPDWYDDWVVIEREQLRQLGLRALEAHAERLLAAGTFGRATDSALTAVRSDPLRESAHRLLIKIHLAEGNWSDAVHQYQLYAHLLREHLGLRPSPQIDELLRRLPRADRSGGGG